MKEMWRRLLLWPERSKRWEEMEESNPVVVVADAERPDWSRLMLSGRVTISSAHSFRDAALAVVASGKNVSICCAEAEYLDVSAIQILLCLGRELSTAGRRCDVTDLSAAMGELFRLAGLGSAA